MKSCIRKIFTCFFLLAIANIAKSQIGINSPLPNKFSALEVKASGKGMYFPRISNDKLSQYAAEPNQGICSGFFAFNHTYMKFCYLKPDTNIYSISKIYDSKVHDSIKKKVETRINESDLYLKYLIKLIDNIVLDTEWVYVCEDTTILNYSPTDFGYKIYSNSKKAKLNNNAWGNFYLNYSLRSANSVLRFRKNILGMLSLEFYNSEANYYKYKNDYQDQSSDTILFVLPLKYRPIENVKIVAQGDNFYWYPNSHSSRKKELFFITIKKDGNVVISKKFLKNKYFLGFKFYNTNISLK